VLGSPPGDAGGSVLIDAGADRRLAAGMAVVDDRGLVGTIVAVGPRHARVELVSSPAARFAVRVVAGGHTGRLRGDGETARLELDDPRAPVAAGAAVVTRSFEGSAVPDGVPVGVIVDAAGTSRQRTLVPTVDRAGLDLVAVVTGAPAHPAAAELPAPSADELPPLPSPPRDDER
jgi:rod shape-determining protein MreC